MITSDAYQKWVTDTSRDYVEVTRLNDWREPNNPQDLPDQAIILALGLCGEAGEVADAIKKCVRDRKCIKLSKKQLRHIKQELGDTLWKLTALSNTFGWTLEQVMDENHRKIERRRAKSKK